MGLGRILALLLSAGCALTLTACGSGATTSTSKPQDGGGIAAELATAPAPAGVDAAIWGQLKTELARVLAVGATGRSPESSVAPGVTPGDFTRRTAGVTPAATDTGRISAAPTLRSVSTPPSVPTAATKLAYDAEASALAWGYCCPGDYNQDGEIGIGDLTPLGLHFGEQSPDGAGQPFPWDSNGAVVDGDGNGAIGIADVTPIGANFGRHVQGYHVYRSFDSADYPQTPTAANGPGALGLGTVTLAQATGSASAGRKQFSLPLTNPQPGAYYWVRPYDGADDGTPSNLAAGQGANLPPIAAIAADPPAGPVPLTVHFSAQASYDADGSLVQYEWDFDGPLNGEQWEDTGATPAAEHTYDKSGDYFPTLRVTDDRGATDTDFAQVSVKSPPVASLDFTGVTDIYKHLLWDAGGSTDADGEIVKYEWDFDGDGVYEYDASASGETAAQQALQDFYYYETGAYSVGVRVTDDDGLTATASKTAALVVAMTWHMTQVDERMDLSSQFGIYAYLILIDVAGRPAMFYTRRLDAQDPVTNSWFGTAFLRANDQSGEHWPTPTIVFNSGPIDAAIVNGNPAFISSKWIAESAGTGDAYEVFVRAFDEVGSSWFEPVQFNHYRIDAGNVVEGLRLGSPERLLDVDGQPALLGLDYSNQPGTYIRSLDANGQSWPEPYMNGAYYMSDQNSVTAIQGLPAIASWVNSKDIVYQRATDATALNWSMIALADESETVGGLPALFDVDGAPAVIYYDVTSESLRYRLGIDASGSTWYEPKTLSNRSNSKFLAAKIDGRLYIMYQDRLDDSLRMIAANDSLGMTWTFPALVPDVNGVFASKFGDYPFELTDVSHRPACSYFEVFGTAPNQGERISYLSYY